MSRLTNWFRNLGAFGLGMFVGTCYGAVVASLVSFAMLTAI